ncbi:MAG: ergosterol biosynthesis family protein [Herbaspirillum sp.]|nr:ergosterol biosynthesis family protein [Herbaspirillum sp.]
MFVAMLAAPALDHRLHRLSLPYYAAIGGDVLVGFGFRIIFFVYKENTFAAAIIECYPDQKVISTGLYARVRHPMYMGAIFLLVGMALALGSWSGLFVFFLFMPALIWRIFDEERFLAKNLPGYRQYLQKVKYRLLPFIW